MTSSLKPSLNELSGSSGETVAEGARRATGETVSPEAARRDPEVVPIAKSCLRTVAFGFPLYGLGMVLTQAFQSIVQVAARSRW